MIIKCINPVWLAASFVFGLTAMWFYFAVFNKKIGGEENEKKK